MLFLIHLGTHTSATRTKSRQSKTPQLWKFYPPHSVSLPVSSTQTNIHSVFPWWYNRTERTNLGQGERDPASVHLHSAGILNNCASRIQIWSRWPHTHTLPHFQTRTGNVHLIIFWYPNTTRPIVTRLSLWPTKGYTHQTTATIQMTACDRVIAWSKPVHELNNCHKTIMYSDCYYCSCVVSFEEQ